MSQAVVHGRPEGHVCGGLMVGRSPGGMGGEDLGWVMGHGGDGELRAGDVTAESYAQQAE